MAPFAMSHPKNIDTIWSSYFVDEIEFGAEYSFLEKLKRVPKVIYSKEAQKKLTALLDVFSADICHAHNIYHHLSPSILKTIKQCGIPVVVTLHDLKLACPAYNMLARDGICERCKGGRVHNVLLHRCIKKSATLSSIILAETMLHRMLRTFEQCVDKFVVPSLFYMNKLVEWGWGEENFIHIPNAIDVENFRPDFNPGRSFLYFGRLSREKGLSTLINAASLAGVSVCIAGTGHEEGLLRKLATDIQANVTFLGYLQGSALHDAIRSSRAVVLPSEWYENAPLSVLEAYALGKPVIGAAIGGIPELIRDGETGGVFPAGSSEKLANLLLKFHQFTDSQISEMGQRGRFWVETEFGIRRYESRMLNLYKKLGVPVSDV